MKKTCVYFLLVIFPICLFGQTDPVPLTQETPYNTIRAHLDYLQQDNYFPEVAAQTLYGTQDSVKKERLAIQLKQVLDGKGLYVRFSRLPRDSNYKDSTSSQSVYVLFPSELPEVYVEQIDGKWYYSPETIEAIPGLHKKVYPFGMDILLNKLPKLGQSKVLGLAVWQYVGLLLIMLLGILMHVILSRILNPIVGRISRSKIYPSLIDTGLIWRIARLISVLVVIRFFNFFLPALQLPVASASFAFSVIKIVTIIFVVLILLRILDIIMAYAKRFTKRTESKMDEQLMPILTRSIQAVIFAAGIIQALRIFEVDITTLIAGISIGGLAIALAAQDTIKNLFGSLTIFMDKPFQIGDWINFNDVDGTVEEVGFRSTRIRTFAKSLVYVPNGKLADMVINNYGLRSFRRFKTTISLTYDTPAILIEKYVEGLRAILSSHPAVTKDNMEIHLNAMSASSLDILIYTFFDVPTWTDELKSRHEIFLLAINLANDLGVRFAFPSSSIYVEEIPGQGRLASYDTNAEAIDKKLEAFKGKL